MDGARLSLRLDEATARRLELLASKLEMKQAAVIRQAVRAFAVRHKVDDAPVPD